MTKRRFVLGVLVVLVTAPVIAVAVVPEWRERAHMRWMVHKLRSPDRETRERAIGALLAKGRPDIDEVFPEVVAAAVANVGSSRTVLVGMVHHGHPGPKAIPMQYSDLDFTTNSRVPYVDIERALSPTPEFLSLSMEQVALQGHLFRLSNARSLIVGEGQRLVLLIPLEGELGDRILDTVERRLAHEREK